MRKDLLNEDGKVEEPFELGSKTYKKWYMSQWNYQQLQSLAEQVNAVDFFNPMYQELTDLWSEYQREEDPGERRKLTEEHYTTLKMMLAES